MSSQHHKGDPFVDFALSAAIRDFRLYLTAPPAVQANHEFITASLKGAHASCYNAQSRSFVVELFESIHRHAPSFFQPKTKAKCELVTNVVREMCWGTKESLVENLSRSFPFYKEAVIQCLRGNAQHYHSLPDDLKQDGSIICVVLECQNISYLSSNAGIEASLLWSQRREVFRAIEEEHGWLPTPIPLEYTRDRQFCVAYLQHLLRNDLPNWIPAEFMEEPAFLSEVARRNPSILKHCKEGLVDLDMILVGSLACKAGKKCDCYRKYWPWKPCEKMKRKHAEMTERPKLNECIKSHDAFQVFLRGVVGSRRVRVVAEQRVCPLNRIDHREVLLKIRAFVGVATVEQANMMKSLIE